jgi:outer membrane receptor for ferrienterochelin and colicin
MANRPNCSSVPITLLAGVRWTSNELFESNLAARGTLVYKVFEGSSIKVGAGQAFRAPTGE